MYGGRVTDDFDRIVLVTYLDEFMGDFLFDKNRPFYFAQVEGYSYCTVLLIKYYLKLFLLFNYLKQNSLNN